MNRCLFSIHSLSIYHVIYCHVSSIQLISGTFWLYPVSALWYIMVSLLSKLFNDLIFQYFGYERT